MRKKCVTFTRDLVLDLHMIKNMHWLQVAGCYFIHPHMYKPVEISLFIDLNFISGL